MAPSDLWTFLFPPEIWIPINDFMSTTLIVATVLGGILGSVYLGLLYADTTRNIWGAWNPWVIFWLVAITLGFFFAIFIAIAWAISPMKLFGIELMGTFPNTCVGDHKSGEGGLCYAECKPGYHGFGVRCYVDSVGIGVGTVIGLEPCPDDNADGTGWVNFGLTCTRWKHKCVQWGTDLIGHWWTGCVETVGRLDHGGLCPGPQDFSGNYDDEIKKWMKSNNKPDPVINPITHKMETAVEANAAGHKTCADIDTVGTDKHTERIDGMCYKKCPPDYPEHIPGMPYLCYKGGDLSYDRGAGRIPPVFRFFDKYGWTPGIGFWS